MLTDRPEAVPRDEKPRGFNTRLLYAPGQYSGAIKRLPYQAFTERISVSGTGPWAVLNVKINYALLKSSAARKRTNGGHPSLYWPLKS